MALGRPLLTPASVTVVVRFGCQVVRPRLLPASATLAVSTGYQVVRPRLEGVDGVLSTPSVPPWFRQVGEVGQVMWAPPTLVGVSSSTGGRLGQLSVVGALVQRSGSALAEVRWAAWGADAVGTVTGAGGAATWSHGLGTAEHLVQVLAPGATLGDCWIELGATTDTLRWTGSYSGPLAVAAVRATAPRSVYQGTQVVDAAGVFVPAAGDTLPVAVAVAPTGGRLGDLVAEAAPGGWRFRCSGSAAVSCRLGIFSVL